MDGSIKPSLVDFKERWRNDILEIPRPVRVPQKAWFKYFPQESSELFSEQCFANRDISIQDLATVANGKASNRVLFIAAMMWGRGSKNGRLMPKFKKVSCHPRFEETLNSTRTLIIDGDPVSAYRTWVESGIKGIGEAFFTKWFFVCGLDSRAKGIAALVLDKRVWNSLSELGWSSKDQTGTKYRDDPAGAYGAYLDAVGYWSNELSTGSDKISPLQVEQFLFRMNGENLR